MNTTVTGPDGLPRCKWCSAAPEFFDYHDREWGFPVDDDQRLFEKLCLESFQSGLSWRTILAKRSLFEAERAALMADPQIADWHLRTVVAHREKIAGLMERAEFRALYDAITGTRLRALSRMLHHFGTNVFLEGPTAVPEDFHLREESV